MNSRFTLIAVLVSTLVVSAHGAQSGAGSQAAFIASAQSIAVAAVTFREGDAAGFDRARANFTADGWKDFVKHMQGFLDQRGAPTFTSTFVAAHDATLVGQQDGVFVLRIPGTLTQNNKLGRTTYRAALEVHAILDSDSTNTVKIQQLTQITCANNSPTCQ